MLNRNKASSKGTAQIAQQNATGYGIGLFPCAEDRERIVACAKKVTAQGDWAFQLNQSDCIPHLSLIHIKNETTSDIVAEWQKHQSQPGTVLPLKFQVQNISYVPEGWYFCNVEDAPKLLKLHEEAFAFAKPYLKPDITKQKNISGYTDHQASMYRQYGYRYIGKSFSPHVTLGRTTDGKQSKRHAEIISQCEGALSGEIRFDKIAIFQLGPDGTCQGVFHSAITTKDVGGTGK